MSRFMKSFGMDVRRAVLRSIVGVAIAGAIAVGSADAQIVRHGNPVPAELRATYQKALEFLVKSQADDGNWGSNTGATGICLMALIATGEDPNFGRYAEPVRKAIRYIVSKQDEATGFIASGMYEHGFAMLALADCYGAVDDELVFSGAAKGKTVAKALEMAVRCAVTSQEQNPYKAWRYSPSSREADTSVSGAIFMGLLGARNAGIEVPNTVIDSALEYYASMTTKGGMVGYAGSFGLGDSGARSAIATLVCAVAKRKDLDTFKAASAYVVDNAESPNMSWPEYWRYYTAQALFQADHDLWLRWNEENTRWVVSLQREDGAIPVPGASGGVAYATGMALLSTALTYCFLPIYER
jgi:hypothetical protein